MLNIKFNYLYRDAGNYKTYSSLIFANPIPLNIEFIEEQIFEKLIDEEYFLPQKWNVPLINKFTYDSELDHDYYEFDSIERTKDAITEKITVDEFLNNINNLWKQPTPSTSLSPKKISS